MRKKAGLIILNYNNWVDTVDAIKSVTEIDYDNFEIYVVDNLSTNNSFEKLKEFKNEGAYQFNLILSPVNGGYAAGNNVGIKAALTDNCDYLLILNNDAVVTPNFLTILVDFLEAHNDVHLCGPRIVNFDDETVVYGARRLYRNMDYFFVPPSVLNHRFPENKAWQKIQYSEKQPYTEPFEIEVLSGSCMLFKRDFFDATGLLDEQTFLYFEELIIYCKAIAKGFKTYIVPEAVIYHKEGKSTDSLKKIVVYKHFINAGRYFMINYQKYSKIKTEFLLSIFYVSLFLSRTNYFIKKLVGKK